MAINPIKGELIMKRSELKQLIKEVIEESLDLKKKPLVKEAEEFDGIEETEPETEYDDKVIALASFLGIDPSDVEENSWGYEADGGEYVVYDDSEADQAAIDSVKSLIDDIGIGGFNINIEDFVEQDWFVEAMDESARSYAEDIKSEGATGYVNRLHAEMVERGIMEEPEEDYDEAQLESEVEDNFEAFIESYNDDYGSDGIKWFIDNFGEDEFNNVVKNNGLIDEDAVAQYVIDVDGRGHVLNSYDGSEEESNGYYIYRTN